MIKWTIGRNFKRTFYKTEHFLWHDSTKTEYPVPIRPTRVRINVMNTFPPLLFHVKNCVPSRPFHKFSLQYPFNKVSKSGRHTDARLYIFSPKPGHNFGFWPQNRKNYQFWPDFIYFNAPFLCFMAIPPHFHVQFFWLEILSAQWKLL